MLTIAIGYDYRESIAFYVLAHSIMRRASQPIRIIPLHTSSLKSIYDRPRSPKQSTDFTYTRFLTPSLAEEGVSVFLDCDMLCLTDICQLEYEAKKHLYSDVLVVKHDYTPHDETKFLGQVQTVYPCKNWSSVMVFNGHRQPVKNLTPAVVNKADAMFLHQFGWAPEVGELDLAWNHLVGEYKPNPDAKIVHFTLGGPWYKGYESCEYAQQWFDELRDMQHRDKPSFDLVRQWI